MLWNIWTSIKNLLLQNVKVVKYNFCVSLYLESKPKQLRRKETVMRKKNMAKRAVKVSKISEQERINRWMYGLRQPEEMMCDENCAKCRRHGCGG